MKDKHELVCNAPICQDDHNSNYKEEVGWLPGEDVCGKYPYEKFQRKQMDINREIKKGTFKNMEQSYTAQELETRSI